LGRTTDMGYDTRAVAVHPLNRHAHSRPPDSARRAADRRTAPGGCPSGSERDRGPAWSCGRIPVELLDGGAALRSSAEPRPNRSTITRVIRQAVWATRECGVLGARWMTSPSRTACSVPRRWTASGRAPLHCHDARRGVPSEHLPRHPCRVVGHEDALGGRIRPEGSSSVIPNCADAWPCPSGAGARWGIWKQRGTPGTRCTVERGRQGRRGPHCAWTAHEGSSERPTWKANRAPGRPGMCRSPAARHPD
jgi:hypothetical protein